MINHDYEKRGQIHKFAPPPAINFLQENSGLVAKNNSFEFKLGAVQIVNLTGVTSLGQFTIADGAPSPTSIQETTMQAVVAEQPGWLVVVMLAVLGHAAATSHMLDSLKKWR